MKKRLAVVVGGSNGIGHATCTLLAEQGWTVVVADIDLVRGRQVADETGGAFVACDVRSAASIAEAADTIEIQHGPVEAVVMCAAAFEQIRPPEEARIEDWDKVIEVGLRGTFLVNSTFGSRMARRGRGAVVNVSSYGSFVSTPAHAYGPMKAAVNRLSENMAAEWGRSGVRVNTVSPGTTLVERVAQRIRTGQRYAGHPGDFTALGRLVEPHEVAAAIAFLLSDQASGITGANLVVDAGALTAMGWPVFGGVPPPRERIPVTTAAATS